PTGIVAVEAEHHAVDQAEQALEMLLAGGSTQGGHGVGDTVLCQGDDIHVALDDHDILKLAVLQAGLVQPVEFASLVEYRGFRRVQILGLVIAQHPAPEAYHPAAAVADGEGDAVTEAVVALAAVR